MIVNHNLGLSGEGVDYDLEDIEELAPVAAALAEEGFGLHHADIAFLKDYVFSKRTVQEYLEIRGAERLQDIYLAAGQEGSDDLEGRVLRRSADKDDGTVLDRTEQGILLGLVEAVDLVDEKDGCEGTGEY